MSENGTFGLDIALAVEPMVEALGSVPPPKAGGDAVVECDGCGNTVIPGCKWCPDCGTCVGCN